METEAKHMYGNLLPCHHASMPPSQPSPQCCISSLVSTHVRGATWCKTRKKENMWDKGKGSGRGGVEKGWKGSEKKKRKECYGRQKWKRVEKETQGRAERENKFDFPIRDFVNGELSEIVSEFSCI